MNLALIPAKFPALSESDLTNIERFITKKCSEFYFLEFLDITKGNIDDAKMLFKLDERLRGILIRYLLRFEIQIKNDFVKYVEASTKSPSFWNDPIFYMPSFLSQTKANRISEFDFTVHKVNEALHDLNLRVSIAPNYEAFYAISYGTFLKIYKSIKPEFKKDFQDLYTTYLPTHDFKTLHSYLSCIRLVRNRCAHGNHIVSNSLVNQLNQFSWITDPSRSPKPSVPFSVFELTLYFLLHQLNCWREMKKELHNVLCKYESIYSKYGGKQSINPTVCKKLFNNHNSSIS